MGFAGRPTGRARAGEGRQRNCIHSAARHRAPPRLKSIPPPAGPPYLKVVKSYARLNHGLQKQFFLHRHFSHPTFFPCIVCCMKLSGVI